MKKFLALAGVAAALVMAVPMAAQADSYRHVERDGPRGGHYERDVYRSHDRDYGRGYDRGYHRGYENAERRERRDFDHWRPGLERSRYHGFGRPVFYDHYYRVPCRDYRDRAVFLTVDAFSGAVISVGF